MSTETTKIPVCPVSELEPGDRRIIEHEGEFLAVVNCDGELFGIEDRCSHDDGPLAEGETAPEHAHEAMLTAMEAGAHLLSRKR